MVQLQRLPGLLFHTGCPRFICLLCGQLLFCNGQRMAVRSPLYISGRIPFLRPLPLRLMDAVQNSPHQLLRLFIGDRCAFIGRIFFRQPAHDRYQFFHFIMHTQAPSIENKKILRLIQTALSALPYTGHNPIVSLHRTGKLPRVPQKPCSPCSQPVWPVRKC